MLKVFVLVRKPPWFDKKKLSNDLHTYTEMHSLEMYLFKNIHSKVILDVQRNQ